MADSPKSSNKVGRGRPPEHSRFKKGTSGNPNGRPPRNRDFKKLVEDELDQQISLTENGKPVRLTKRQVIVKTLVNDAAKGDARALQTLVKLIGGASEPEKPMIGIGAAELARFAMRHLPAGEIERENDNEDGVADQDEGEPK